MKKEKTGLKLYHKIFIGLFAGIIVGYILNLLGGQEHAFIGGKVLPFLQFLGNFFIKLIRMVVVPLVFFSITESVLNLGDMKKLRGIGIKTILMFLGTAMIAVTIGLVLANVIKPGLGVTFTGEVAEVQMKEMTGIYDTILNLFPSNPFESLTKGDMMPIIVFSIFLGCSLLSIGDKADPVKKVIEGCSAAMFKIIDMVLVIIPYGVFGLMGNAMAVYGVAIFGPVLKFIATDYLAAAIHTLVIYSLMLTFIAKVSPLKFWRRAFESWVIAFSTCTSAAALPVAMKIAPEIGVPKETANFVLPLGATANMNGTCIYFGIIVIFATQLYGIEISIQQQILLAIQATLLSVGCAAMPQVGLVISITLLSSLGLPLEATALVAGIYRIIDQAHTSTNSVGDLVTAVCVSAMEGDLDREQFEIGTKKVAGTAQ